MVLMLASLIPPVDLFVHSFKEQDDIEGVVAVACGVLYLLMLSRLWDVAATNRRSLFRERTLRVASAALASAGSVEEVATAVTDAASALTAAQPANRTALLAVRDGDYLRYVHTAGSAEPRLPARPGRHLAAARRKGARRGSSPRRRSGPPGTASGRPRPGRPSRC